MSAQAFEVIVATFPNEQGAAATMSSLEEMARSGAIEIVDAGILVRKADGSTQVTQHALPSVGGGAKVGAIAGAVIGVLFPPAIIGSALVGAGIGAGAAKLGKELLKSDELEQAAKDLEPGTSAIVAVVDDTWVRQLEAAMQGYRKLAAHSLDADSAARLAMVGDDETGAAAATFDAFETDEDTGAAVATSVHAATDGAGNVAVSATTAAVSDDGIAVEQIDAVGSVALPDDGDESDGAQEG